MRCHSGRVALASSALPGLAVEGCSPDVLWQQSVVSTSVVCNCLRQAIEFENRMPVADAAAVCPAGLLAATLASGLFTATLTGGCDWRLQQQCREACLLASSAAARLTACHQFRSDHSPKATYNMCACLADMLFMFHAVVLIAMFMQAHVHGSGHQHHIGPSWHCKVSTAQAHAAVSQAVPPELWQHQPKGL